MVVIFIIYLFIVIRQTNTRMVLLLLGLWTGWLCIKDRAKGTRVLSFMPTINSRRTESVARKFFFCFCLFVYFLFMVPLHCYRGANQGFMIISVGMVLSGQPVSHDVYRTERIHYCILSAMDQFWFKSSIGPLYSSFYSSFGFRPWSADRVTCGK